MSEGLSSPIPPMRAPLIVHNAEACKLCLGCVRHCPAHAIRVVDGPPEILRDRCVNCGVCVTHCASGCYEVRSDLSEVQRLLTSGRPIVVVMASEHVAALHPLSTLEVERSLEALGFDAVETTALGEELVAAAYEQVHLRSHDVLPRLRSTCPVVVGWIQRFQPQLVSALVSIVPPYIAQARLVKEIYPPGTAVVYVSPCWARKDEIHERQLAGAVDVAIGFDELRLLLAEAPAAQPDAVGRDATVRRPRFAKELSLTDGFPRRTLVDSCSANGDMVTVRGLNDIDRLLTGIIRGEVAPAVVDVLNCEGCADGPAVNTVLSVFAKRNLIAADRELQQPPPAGTRAYLSALPAIELRRTLVAMPALTRMPAAEEIDAVLAAGEFISRGEVMDCGACGYDTCVEHASAICLGASSWEQCLPLQRRVMQRDMDNRERTALVDELTGMGTARSFDQRMESECARALRAGSPLSLALIGLDRFKDINGAFGQRAGDDVMRGFGAVLTKTLRASDIPVRLGGDEFAVILPDSGKTDAWIVAERLRAAFAEISVDSGGAFVAIPTVSIGISSFGEVNRTPDDLLAAATAALQRAKGRGRDRVELAAG